MPSPEESFERKVLPPGLGARARLAEGLTGPSPSPAIVLSALLGSKHPGVRTGGRNTTARRPRRTTGCGEALGRGLPPGRPPSLLPHRCSRLTESWASRPPWLLRSRRHLRVQLPALRYLPNRWGGYGCGKAGLLAWLEGTSPAPSAAIREKCPAHLQQ